MVKTMLPPLLEIPNGIYSALIADLAKSGGGIKEAGAFLLGHQEDRTRRVLSYLMYDVVAPESSRRHNYVSFTADEMARAWNYCYANGLQVVADVHTHPLARILHEWGRQFPLNLL